MQDNTYNPMAAPVAPAPAPVEEKSSNTKFYVIIAILVFIIVGLSVTLALVLLKPQDKKSGDVADNCEEVREELNAQFRKERGEEMEKLQLAQRDMFRQDSISYLLTAVNTYQSNNNGKTPWSSGSTDPMFITRYVDETCENPVTNGQIMSFGSCSGDFFVDVDGTTFKIQYLGSMDRTSSGSSAFDGNLEKVMDAWPNDHKVVVASYARCGNDGYMVRGTGERQVALAYRLENGSITCNDNH